MKKLKHTLEPCELPRRIFYVKELPERSGGKSLRIKLP